jgi:CheY-like chemotaxis protein
MDDFLSKPYTPAVLQEKIEQWTRSAAEVAPSAEPTLPVE